MRLLRWLLVPPAVLIAIIFAVANRSPVEVSLYPLPWMLPPVPQYMLLFAGVLIGLAIGMLAGWWGMRRWRRIARQHRQEAAEAGRELARVKAARLEAEAKQLPPVNAA